MELILFADQEAYLHAQNKTSQRRSADPDHSYESVKRDVEAWFPRIRIGGIVSGHDYNGRGDRSTSSLRGER